MIKIFLFGWWRVLSLSGHDGASAGMMGFSFKMSLSFIQPKTSPPSAVLMALSMVI
jgi:hypothetical protein